MTYIALGAFAACLGFWGSSGARLPQVHFYPVVFALGMAFAGVALLTRNGKRSDRHAHPSQRLGQDRQGIGAVPAARGGAGARMRDEEPVGEAALLGHEMKNYLCTLRGNARLLRQRSQGTDNDIIDRIDRVVEKLESFTWNMGRAPEATASGVLWHLRVGDAAQACVKTHFHGSAEGFHWDIQDSAYTLLGDPDRLEQVFLNLYSNALEAGARSVTTSLHRVGDSLRLRIEDDGRGCAPEYLARIFEPFFTTKSGPARRGLGMFIVQSIVENHGGNIRVACKNGLPAGAHGLIFMLDFPLSRDVPAAARPEIVFHNSATQSIRLPWLLPLPKIH